jgi:signal transduction histidine kinase
VAFFEDPGEPGVPFRCGIHVSGGLLRVSTLGREKLADFVRRQIRQMHDIHSGAPRLVQLDREQIAFVPIVAREEPGKDKDEKTILGWVAIGTAKALSPREEALLTVVLQRLSDLARIYRLEDRLAMRSQFLSIASHELKTPLTAIYGVLQLQERMLRIKRSETEVLQPEKQHAYLKMVIRQVERLNELIDGLLDVSRIQNGRFMVEPTESDVPAILNETLAARLAVIASEAGVKLQAEGPLQLKGWIDPVRFEEVVTNLVMNSIRFSPEGGVVWIKLKEDEGGGFRLTVRDQGPTVAIDDRERIFHPFERAQRTARLGGLGLGLFISRQIAQLHGGNVALIESVPGKGNLFEASFPARAHLRAISA